MAPGDYNGPTCTVVQTVMNETCETCADLPDGLLPVQTIPLVLSSTIHQPTSSHDLQPIQLAADLPDGLLPVQTIPLVLSSTIHQPTSSHDLQPIQLATPLVPITSQSTGQQI